MAINRFNQPIRSEFLSQYVPLPIAEIQQALGAKQYQADMNSATVEAESDKILKTKSLGWHDTEYVKGVGQKVQEFQASLEGKDLASPEVSREIKKFTREIASDPNLQKVSQAVQIHDRYQENYKKARDKGDHALAKELTYKYNRALENYTKEGGQGFNGRGLENPDFQLGTDLNAAMEPYFNNLGDNGAEAVKKLGDTYYKEGWRGVTSGQVGNRANQAFLNFYTTNAARQLDAQYDMYTEEGQTPMTKDPKTGEVKPMSKQQYAFEQFLNTGMEKVGVVTSTNIDSAANREFDRAEGRAKDDAVVLSRLDKYAAPGVIEGIRFNDAGDIKGSGTQSLFEYIAQEGKTRMAPVIPAMYKWFKDNGLSKEEADRFKPILIGAKESGMTARDYYDKLNKFEDFKTTNYVNEKKASDATKLFFNGQWTSAKVIDPETSKPRAAIEFFQDKGIMNKDGSINQEKFKEMGGQINGEVFPNSRVSKGLHGNIGNTTFVLDLSENASDAEHDAHLRERAKAMGVAEDEVKGHKLYYIYNPQKNEVIVKSQSDYR